MSKKHVFLKFFSKIALFACVFCVFFISPVFANLPAGYTELEYIEVPATAYINLGVYPAAHGRLRVKFSPIDLGSNYLCGHREGGDSLYSGIMGSVTGNTINSVMVRDASAVSVTSNIIRKANNVYDIQANAKYVEGAGYTTELTVNNLTTGEIETVVGKRFVANPISINQNMLLFAVNATNKLPKARGYLYMYWNDDGELVRHLVPAKRNSDSVLGMYDLVSQTFFTNSGTGDFIAGPVANCKTFGTDGVTCTECETDYILNNDGGCSEKIKIATTKYVDDEFAPLDTALENAISVVDNVVTQTIAQAGQIATLQNTKQTRPDDDDECPAGKKCLLVTDESGTPHWYPIIEP